MFCLQETWKLCAASDYNSLVLPQLHNGPSVKIWFSNLHMAPHHYLIPVTALYQIISISGSLEEYVVWMSVDAPAKTWANFFGNTSHSSPELPKVIIKICCENSHVNSIKSWSYLYPTMQRFLIDFYESLLCSQCKRKHLTASMCHFLLSS